MSLFTTQRDIDLWTAFKSGDKTAFAGLFKKFYPVLIEYGSKLCPDKQIAEDCIQELFIEVWQSKTAQPVQSVKAYLLRALRYKIFKALAKSSAREHLTDSPEEVTFQISHETFLIKQADSQLHAERVLAAINSLTTRQKEIIYLKIFKNLSYEEISEVMDINYQVARNLFSQSIKALRSILGS